MITKRANELMAAMQSFNKETYHKSEILSEMLNLQQEIVRLTFNEEHADIANLKIWDVENHLKQMNEECGHVADEELQRFMNGSKILCNLIKAEISGNRGESKAFRTLDFVKSRNLVLKNVELTDGDRRTELDAVVITPVAITIIEVKNTARNIFIDNHGNYYRTGEFLKWDCDIAGKMKLKAELLRKALAGTEFENLHIESIVVFTDSRIEVQNKCQSIRTCFVSQLSYIIDALRGGSSLSDEKMLAVKALIEEAACHESYPFRFDAQQYKKDFAVLMATLELASLQRTEEIEAPAIDETKEEEKYHCKPGFTDIMKAIFSSRYARYAGRAVATIAISAISTAITNSTLNK